MVNEEKVKLMTKVAHYEQLECSEEIKENGYYKTDYVRHYVLRNIWMYSAAYVLIWFLILFERAGFLFSNEFLEKYNSLLMQIFGFYMLVLILCIVFTSFHYLKKYERNKKEIQKYTDSLKALEEFYDREKKGEDS